MSYEFKSIADVEVVAEPGKSANVLIEENGVIKKAPKTAVGGGDRNYIRITVDMDTNEMTVTDNAYNIIKDNPTSIECDMIHVHDGFYEYYILYQLSIYEDSVFIANNNYQGYSIYSDGSCRYIGSYD